MLKIDTKAYKSIEFEIDGKVYQTKKITNRIILAGLRIADKMKGENVPQEVQYECLVDLIILYTPLEREWVLDNLSPDDMQKLMTYITDQITAATEKVGEPPLGDGTSGGELPK